MNDALQAHEIERITGKKRAASQAAELAKRGIAYRFTGAGVIVERAVAMAYDLLPTTQRRGVDMSKVR